MKLGLNFSISIHPKKTNGSHILIELFRESRRDRRWSTPKSLDSGRSRRGRICRARVKENERRERDIAAFGDCRRIDLKTALLPSPEQPAKEGE